MDDYRDSLTDTTAPLGILPAKDKVTGQIEIGGDKDVFAFDAVVGQRYSYTSWEPDASDGVNHG